jgi:hypothetical protein
VLSRALAHGLRSGLVQAMWLAQLAWRIRRARPRGHRVQHSHGGAAGPGLPEDKVGRGMWREHRCGTGKEPGKVLDGEAHWTGGGDVEVKEALVRQRWWLLAVFNSPEGILQFRRCRGRLEVDQMKKKEAPAWCSPWFSDGRPWRPQMR